MKYLYDLLCEHTIAVVVWLAFGALITVLVDEVCNRIIQRRPPSPSPRFCAWCRRPLSEERQAQAHTLCPECAWGWDIT